MHWKPRSWMLIGILLTVMTVAGVAQVATTQVADTIYHADGTVATGTVLISWPADVPAFVLESSSDYSSWAQLSIPVGLSANNYVVRVRTSGARAYYRLRFVAPPGVP